jgi:hypothetical protein
VKSAKAGGVCDRAAVVAGAGGDQGVHGGLVAERALDSPRRAQDLERGQAEPVGLVLDLDGADAELGGNGVELVDRRRCVVRQARWNAVASLLGEETVVGSSAGLTAALTRRNASTPTSVRAASSVSERLTQG